MMKKLDEKVAVVTGASKGIGAEIQADVSKKVEIEQLFAKAQQVFGKLDILINNAGIYGSIPLEDITEEAHSLAMY